MERYNPVVNVGNMTKGRIYHKKKKWQTAESNQTKPRTEAGMTGVGVCLSHYTPTEWNSHPEHCFLLL